MSFGSSEIGNLNLPPVDSDHTWFCARFHTEWYSSELLALTLWFQLFIWADDWTASLSYENRETNVCVHTVEFPPIVAGPDWSETESCPCKWRIEWTRKLYSLVLVHRIGFLHLAFANLIRVEWTWLSVINQRSSVQKSNKVDPVLWFRNIAGPVQNFFRWHKMTCVKKINFTISRHPD